MGVNDGTIIGVTKVVDNGPDSSQWNLVIFGDGYTGTVVNQAFAQIRWVGLGELSSLDFLEADRDLVRRLDAGDEP